MPFLRSVLFQRCYPEYGRTEWSDCCWQLHGGPLSRGLRNWSVCLRALSVGDSPQTAYAVASTGNDLATTDRFMETVGMASEQSELICPSLSAEATEAIINCRAVSTRRLCAFKLKLFTTWCRRRDMDHAYCHIASVLEFLQSHFSEGITPATLKVYLAAISANHAYIDGVSVGRHRLVSRFMQGSQRLKIKVVLSQSNGWLRLYP